MLSIGIDLGGTKIEGVVMHIVDDAPKVLTRRRVPTERERGYEHIVEAVAALIVEVATTAGLSASELPPIGVGMPGSVTRATGLIKNANTTCLNGRPFREDLGRMLGPRAAQPIAFSNDANCFALAEARFGAGRGHEVVFGVILGTGVGGGIVLPGRDHVRIWDGPLGLAGEWGHVTLDPISGPPCYCGRRGCIETYLCGPAIEADYLRRSGRSRPLAEIARRAEGEDPDVTAVAALDAALTTFGRALATVINILDPDIVVLGGGVSNLDLFTTRGPAAITPWIFGGEFTTPIVRHKLGDSAGVLGAALLALGS